MRRNVVAGNWKMNNSFDQAEELLSAIADELDKIKTKASEVVVCPPFPYLEMAKDIALECDFGVGAQNVSQFDAGAYTGEISASMLASMSVKFCIIGHSERRKYFGETDETLAIKVKQLLANDIEPIFCIGELLEEREANRHFDVVKEQMEKGLFHLSADEFHGVIIAYEPVWAIGTGKTATSEQAQEMHVYIRTLISKKYGQSVADDITILYGGSCNAKNAQELFANKDVDGGLIGGASLKAEDFITIVQSF